MAVISQLTSRPRTLVVLERGDDVAWLSLRNVDTIHVLSVDQLNTYDVLLSDDVIFTKGAYDAFVAGPSTGKSVKAVATSTEAQTLDAPADEKPAKKAAAKKAEKPAEAKAEKPRRRPRRPRRPTRRPRTPRRRTVRARPRRSRVARLPRASRSRATPTR